MKIIIIPVVLVVTVLLACTPKPRGIFMDTSLPPRPDYSISKNWAALPGRPDSADLTPVPELENNQSTTQVDVFYLHPTTFTGKAGRNQWNARLDDHQLNLKTDRSPIRYQATIFNNVGKIYAPRYRQAHLRSFFTKKYTAAAQKAWEVAYSDVKAAFEYYLEHYNQGRPFIIAGHSQGARHGARLIRELIDGTRLQNRMVVAYLAGWPIERNYFNTIPVCESPYQTGCFCSWRTYKTNYFPKGYKADNNIAVVNPLHWSTDTTLAPATLNKGAVLRDFNKIYPELATAKIHDGLLWCDKPKFRGSWLLWTGNFHAGDMNLYYMNIRENAAQRVKAFWKR